ncbi:hypothetical protein HEB94_004717 [Actinopolymorpha pittospori]|uniref:Uncharacterized protein n=1 Tax=Actinopolymorpha pittospori TaxID=648752 RepID=A0A927MWF9_9ACTN|nr:hypothetical protein [Actinopolymorpha pittospori]MBE1607869.1 hypothetical protein [Actinopolymorpha pittospori]
MNDSILLATPYPCRTDGEIDAHRGGDAEQVPHQIENPGTRQSPDDRDIHGQGDQRGAVELGESEEGHPAGAEGPDLVEHVVVGDGDLGRRGRGEHQRNPRHPVQQMERQRVESHPDQAHQ